jgi:hypothetical protein
MIHGLILSDFRRGVLQPIAQNGFLFFGISRPIEPENSPFMVTFSHVADARVFHFGTE